MRTNTSLEHSPPATGPLHGLRGPRPEPWASWAKRPVRLLASYSALSSSWPGRTLPCPFTPDKPGKRGITPAHTGPAVYPRLSCWPQELPVNLGSHSRGPVPSRRGTAWRGGAVREPVSLRGAWVGKLAARDAGREPGLGSYTQIWPGFRLHSSTRAPCTGDSTPWTRHRYLAPGFWWL